MNINDKSLYIERLGQFIQIAEVDNENHKLLSYYPEYIDSPSPKVGEIYCARITKVVRAINGIFVDLGNNQQGFLSLNTFKDTINIPMRYPNKLVNGTKLLVQVKQEANNEKLAQVSVNIELKSCTGVLTPFKKEIGISQRIKKESQRFYFKQTIEAILQDNSSDNNLECGFIIRSSASKYSDEILAMQSYALLLDWNKILEEYQNSTSTKVLYKLDNLSSILCYHISQDHNTIYINDSELQNNIRKFACRYGFSSVDNINSYNGNKLFDEIGLTEQIEELFNPQIELSSGGNIVINQHKALTCIDINSSKLTEKTTNFAELAQQINLEACGYILNAIKLRQISGQIIVDFLKAGRGVERQITNQLNKLNKVLQLPLQIYGLSRLGLFELTNKKISSSLLDKCQNPLNYELNNLWKCYFLLREALNLQANYAKQLTIKADYHTIQLLKHELKPTINEIKSKFIAIHFEELEENKNHFIIN